MPRFLPMLCLALAIAAIAAPTALADCPGASSASCPYVSIAQNGQLFVSFATGPTSTEMHPTTLDTMAGMVAQSLAVANPTGEQVFIRADQHVKYGVFMSVVNRLQIDGYYKIGLISEEVQS